LSLLLFLNELSRPADALPDYVARGIINALVRLLHAVRRERGDIVLHSAYSIRGMQIGNSYSVGQWCNEGENLEEWRFLRSLDNRAPFRTGLASISADLDAIEYSYNGIEAEGLGLAHLFGGLAVSFDSDEEWRAIRVRLLRASLEENDQGEVHLAERDIEVVHVCSSDQVATIREWLQDACRNVPQSGEEMWLGRAQLFPHLSFLPRVEAQLRLLTQGNPWFGAIFQRLMELSDAVGEWNPAASPQPNYRSRVTGEYDQRRRLCEFRDLDGEVRVFDLHSRFTPGAGRLYFRLAGDRNHAVVAHAGRKIDA